MENNTATETKTETALTAAQEIRKALKAAYPGFKFSVVKPHWGSVDVRWTDGPAESEVEKIAGKFQAGYFDGMTDCYEYSKDRPACAVRFVSCQREISKGLRDRVRADLIAIYSGDDFQIDRYTHNMTRRADLRKAYKGIEFVGGVDAFNIVTE